MRRRGSSVTDFAIKKKLSLEQYLSLWQGMEENRTRVEQFVEKKWGRDEDAKAKYQSQIRKNVGRVCMRGDLWAVTTSVL